MFLLMMIQSLDSRGQEHPIWARCAFPEGCVRQGLGRQQDHVRWHSRRCCSKETTGRGVGRLREQTGTGEAPGDQQQREAFTTPAEGIRRGHCVQRPLRMEPWQRGLLRELPSWRAPLQ